MTVEERRKHDRENKQLQRKLNSPYAQRVRESKRSERVKAHRRELRSSPEHREKEAAYIREYRKRPEQIIKNKARSRARFGLINGIIVRPDCCDVCKQPDKKLRNGKSGLRMDHYMGYDDEHAMIVRFICVTCDGKQMRKHD